MNYEKLSKFIKNSSKRNASHLRIRRLNSSPCLDIQIFVNINFLSVFFPLESVMR